METADDLNPGAGFPSACRAPTHGQMGGAEPERGVIVGPRRAAPPRARAADGAAGLLSALGAPGVRGGAAGEPRSEPRP